MPEHFRYTFTTRHGYRAHAGVLTENDLPDGRDRWAELIRPVGAPLQDWAFDLSRVAQVLYVADRRSSRRRSQDGWVRDITVQIPVASPSRWADATPTLTRLLTVLTADRWTLEFTQADQNHLQPTLQNADPANEVATFSGGLDSTAFAVERATIATNDPLLLVSFYHAQLRNQQQRIHHAISKLAQRPLLHVQLPQSITGKHLERTQRTRGLLFAAAAIYAAAGHGVTSISMPENGPMAINLPMTESRTAACSTRSVHPTSLALLNEVIAIVGGAVRVDNPYRGLTKGEVCQQALTAGLHPATLAETMSCGGPHHRKFTHCGLCYPCLVRRAGLHAVLNGDPTNYRTALTQVDLDKPQGSNEALRAAILWTNNAITPMDLMADLPLPPDIPLRDALTTVTKGQREMRDYLDNELRPLRRQDVPASPRIPVPRRDSEASSTEPIGSAPPT